VLADLALLLVMGAVAGVLAGLLGIGGGIVIVPVLALVFAHQGVAPEALMHLAVGTSLATIVITSLSSIRAHQRRAAVRWPVFRSMAPGVVLGALFGAAVANTLPGPTLQLVFAVFLLAVATQMAIARPPAPHRALPGPVGLAGSGGLIGTVSAVMGVGGGSMTVPFLSWCNVPVRNAVATSAAVGLPIAVAGTLGFVVAGWSAPARPPWSVGFVSLPAFLGIVVASTLFAPLGARIAHAIPERVLKRAFAVFLGVLGLRLLLF
jgi:uncharacterized membrane protein YfcA